MSSPNMSTLAASLENCSLNHQGGGGGEAARGAQSPGLELNSEAPLPYHWEQCLDLKSGEVYYINWRTGMKATDDPRTTTQYSGEYYSDDDSSSYDSDGSSSESFREQWTSGNYYEQNNQIQNNMNNSVLVVAGCKSCLMYYMVPKLLQICPKCCGQLLHFDRSENNASP